ncbi:MAG: hypothetical protein ABR557_02040, partial [Pyrinomonadaceae bacterium]
MKSRYNSPLCQNYRHYIPGIRNRLMLLATQLSLVALVIVVSGFRAEPRGSQRVTVQSATADWKAVD